MTTALSCRLSESGIWGNKSYEILRRKRIRLIRNQNMRMDCMDREEDSFYDLFRKGMEGIFRFFYMVTACFLKGCSKGWKNFCGRFESVFDQ